MRRGTSTFLAAQSAFTGSLEASVASGAVEARLKPAAVAFVGGFPGAIGILGVLAAFTRSGVTDGAFPPAIVMLLLAGALVILGVRSHISIDPDLLSVRFFGVRATTVRFDRLTSATFGMAFPSISYAIAISEADDQKALFHANWWQREPALLAATARGLVASDVPMDRATARIVSRVLRIQRPKARITHHALLRKDRTL